MNVYEAVKSAMADIEPIAKAQKNEKQGWTFRGIDVIMNELQPILKKNGLFVVPKVEHIERQERGTKDGGVLMYSVVTMEYNLYSEDGTFITGSVVGEGMDSGDKASNKAMSIAFKYFLLQTFCIPTADEKDPDEKVHEPVSIRQESQKPKYMPTDEAIAKLNACKTLDELKNTFIALRARVDPADMEHFVNTKDLAKGSLAFDDAKGEIIKIGRMQNENNK